MADNEEQLKINQRTSSYDGFNKQIFAHPRIEKREIEHESKKLMQIRRENFSHLHDLRFQWKAINPFVSLFVKILSIFIKQ